jgi:hypothetical protein
MDEESPPKQPTPVRGRWGVWLLGVILLATAVGVACFLVLPSPFSQADYKRVRVGMTAEEAEAALGRPPGYYGISSEAGFVLMAEEGKVMFGRGHEGVEVSAAVHDLRSNATGKTVAQVRRWVASGGTVRVITQDGRVIGKSYWASPTSRNWWNWLKGLPRRLIHKPGERVRSGSGGRGRVFETPAERHAVSVVLRGLAKPRPRPPRFGHLQRACV